MAEAIKKVKGSAAKPKAKSKAAGGRVKDLGRRPGSPNKGNGEQRKYFSKIRCTEGYKNTIDALKLQDPAGKLSEADILHEALQLYAVRKLSKPGDLFWANKIV